ncbi:DUF2306 domain-containing protein [Ampullimonas aquatilis]|uniref:DUF2306 domain-containing protein n=1 Tax=Ampullimonas aquatilis TaxID=1341549 RepID=UPI003C71166A
MGAILNATLAIRLHLLMALSALVLGALMLFLKKGTPWHKSIGYLWVIIMLLTALSSFGIQGSQLAIVAGYSPIHFLSIFVLVTVPLAVFLAIKGKINAHRKAMKYIYFGGLLLPGLLTLIPGRLLGNVFWHGLGLL